MSTICCFIVTVSEVACFCAVSRSKCAAAASGLEWGGTGSAFCTMTSHELQWRAGAVARKSEARLECLQ